MRIGLVGYYGWGNFGDELFRQLFEDKFFPDLEFELLHDAKTSAFVPNLSERLGRLDAVFIGGGDLLNPGNVSWLYWDERLLSKPVFCIGIGVPTWVPTNLLAVRRYQAFLSHPNVKWISLRDSASKTWVEKNLSLEGEAKLHPDLVLALGNNDAPGHLGDRRQVLALALRHQSRQIPETLLDTVQAVGESFGLEMELPILGTGMTRDDDVRFLLSQKRHHEKIREFQTEAEIDSYIGSVEFLASTKFHGLIMAFVRETNFLSLSGANKFKEFLRYSGNQSRDATWLDLDLEAKLRDSLSSAPTFASRGRLQREVSNAVAEISVELERL